MCTWFGEGPVASKSTHSLVLWHQSSKWQTPFVASQVTSLITLLFQDPPFRGFRVPPLDLHLTSSAILHVERLSKWLGRDLPATFLLDFPSVAELATELDRRAGAATNGKANGVTNGATNGGYHGTKGKEEVKLVVEKELLIQVRHGLGIDTGVPVEIQLRMSSSFITMFWPCFF